MTAGPRRLALGLVVIAVGVMGMAACVADPPPLNAIAVPGDGRVLLSWDPPLVAGAPITSYVLTAWVGSTPVSSATFDASTTSRIFGGLSNGNTYTFTVKAINTLGNRSASSDQTESVIPGQQVSGAATRTCALADQGTVKCWGEGSLTPTAVPGLTGATSVSVGSSACALIVDGTIKCWGSNFYGELGNGTTTDSATPVTVTGITDATAIAVRTVAACALLRGGSVQCWGNDFSGHAGDPWDYATTPWTVPGISGATTIAAGDAETCAVVTGGVVKCWGNTISDGASGYTMSARTPYPITDITGASLVAVGADHFCVRLPGGAMKCLGQAYFGQLGGGFGGDGEYFNPPEWEHPIAVVGGTFGARVLTAGYADTCAIVDGGAVKCWGRNDHGQVGNGTSGYPYPNTPQSVTGLSNVIALAAGAWHTCAVVSDTVRCWGDNTYGQLGTGSAGGSSTTPVQVIGL